ncbi:MAG: hypothetical protein VX764_01655 [Planctomycetota bacterium]|nr:hypothetical protein [Planctomycetota bacterium]
MQILIRVIPLVLIGAVVGAGLGMLITEGSFSGPPSRIDKEAGFSGFIYGMWTGGAVGLVAAVLWSISSVRNSTEHPGSSSELNQ